MRIFVTGATGFVGTAIVAELVQAGHQVTGLARSETAARSLTAAGAGAHRGDLEDLAGLRAGAAEADGVIHAGFVHDFTRYKEVCEIDRRAIEALGTALAGSDRPLLVTSGTALLASGRLVTEGDVSQSSLPRVSEAAAAAVSGVRAPVIRLPPTVHGDGDHGFVPHLIKLARDKGASAYVGDGQNRWPAVHRLDAARLYRLAIEDPAAAGPFHAVAETGVEFRRIAAAIGKGLGLPVISVPAERATEHFGWFAHFAALDNPASSSQTRERLDWSPDHRALLDDLEHGTYFDV